jgi:hypothetical protein
VQQLLRASPLVRFEPPTEAAPVPAVPLARPARPPAGRTLAEARTAFPTALNRTAFANTWDEDGLHDHGEAISVVRGGSRGTLACVCHCF